MARGECPTPRPECPYVNREGGCFSDLDHIVPQRLGRTALAAIYINLPSNKQQLCRWLHEQKTAEGDEPLPPKEVMFMEVAAAQLRGEISLSNRKLRKVFGPEWRSYKHPQQATLEVAA